jgi:ComF family protein
VSTLSLISTAFNDFVSLIYPNTCCCCDSALTSQEQYICLHCDVHLPKLFNQTSVMHKFIGKLSFDQSFALYQYEKRNRIQYLIDEIKYKNNQALALYMGKRMGTQLLDQHFMDYDGIMPVPLHSSKLKQRGYNQSELLAKGIAEVSGLPLLVDLLKKSTASQSQTQKSRFARWTNVQTVFEAHEKVKDMKIILVDDVLTTGATLIACAESLIQKNTAKVSFLALASAVSL